MKKIFLLIIYLGLCFLLSGCFSSAGNISNTFNPGSFAVITDLHIGYGIPDYYPDYPTKPGFTWLDGAEGHPGDNERNKHCAEKLELVVDKIIKEKDKYNIRFVIILGDIADTAEKSEFQVAWKILVKLNDAGIAFITIDGNHCIWPYTESEDDFDPNDRSRIKDVADFAAGDRFFEEIFWGDDNAKNIKLIKNLFGDSWERNKNPVKLPNVLLPVNLQNFGFSWGDITFLGLDLVSRDQNSVLSSTYPGKISLAVEHQATIDFSVDYFSRHFPANKTVILFSHYPIGGVEGFRKYIAESNCNDVYYFSGHIHRQSESSKALDVYTYEILTEDTAGIDLPFTGERSNTPIRIVKISKNGAVDYSTLLAREMIVPEIIEKTRGKLINIGSFHFELDHSGGLTQVKDLIGTDTVGIKKISADVILPDKMSGKATISLSALNFIGKSFNIKLIGDTFYYDYGGRWQNIGGIDYNKVGQAAFVADFLDKIVPKLDKLTDQTINNTECYHLSGQIDSEDIGVSLTDDSFSLDVWISKNTFNILQIKIQGRILSNDKEGIVRTLKFSNFNQLFIIDPP